MAVRTGIWSGIRYPQDEAICFIDVVGFCQIFGVAGVILVNETVRLPLPVRNISSGIAFMVIFVTTL